MHTLARHIIRYSYSTGNNDNRLIIYVSTNQIIQTLITNPQSINQRDHGIITGIVELSVGDTKGKPLAVTTETHGKKVKH